MEGDIGFYWKDCQDNRQLYLSVDIDETGLGIFAFVERVNDKIPMSSSGRVRPNEIAKIYNLSENKDMEKMVITLEEFVK